jgi:rare lipoprotein A
LPKATYHLFKQNVLKQTAYIFFFFINLASVSAQEISFFVGDMFFGKASFYHDKFNGRKTSCGEIFSNQDFTAAHNTLPFGTLVEVTNEANNQKVTVRINDRGPYSHNRIIDVTRMVAEILGFVNSGEATVTLKVIKLPDSDYTYTGFVNYGTFDTTAFKSYEPMKLDTAGGKIQFWKPENQPKIIEVSTQKIQQQPDIKAIAKETEFDEFGFRKHTSIALESVNGKIKMVEPEKPKTIEIAQKTVAVTETEKPKEEFDEFGFRKYESLSADKKKEKPKELNKPKEEFDEFGFRKHESLNADKKKEKPKELNKPKEEFDEFGFRKHTPLDIENTKAKSDTLKRKK